MKLLIVTQVVDTKDTYLSFFHTWIETLAEKAERIEVVCLYEGTHALPSNVRVYSLGKEKGARSSLSYAVRFISCIWKLRKEYDTVLVHMNEEYVLLGGLIWKTLRKPLYLWRNHYAGTLRTKMAGMLSTKVFYTSKHSYTASFKNAVRMPVGVDLSHFRTTSASVPRSILFFARFTPSKRPDLVVEALGLLAARGITFTASFYGPVLPADEAYRARTEKRAQELGLTTVSFHPGVPHDDAPRIFEAHDIYVNLGGSGMLDKTLFEAAAAGSYVLSRSEDWRDFAGDSYYIDSDTPEAVAASLEYALTHSDADRTPLQEVASAHSLQMLIPKLYREMSVE